MFVPSGILVGIPLTLMQTLSLQATGDSFPSVTVLSDLCALNFALAHSIYDADRLRDEPNPDAFFVGSTRFATGAGLLLLAARDETRPFVPAALALHAGYADAKPAIAPVKPLFVGTLWGLATTTLPFLRTQSDDVHTLMAMVNALQIGAWSNLADVKDIDEDLANKIRTPAVFLGPTASRELSVVMLIFAAILRYEDASLVNPSALIWYDTLNAAAMLKAVADPRE